MMEAISRWREGGGRTREEGRTLMLERVGRSDRQQEKGVEGRKDGKECCPRREGRV